MLEQVQRARWEEAQALCMWHFHSVKPRTFPKGIKMHIKFRPKHSAEINTTTEPEMEGSTFLIEHLLLLQLFYLTFKLQHDRQTFIISPYSFHRKVCLLRLHSNDENRRGKDNCIRFTALVFRNVNIETTLCNTLQRGCHFTDQPLSASV